jgi:ABC-type multidrug transport system fused ATPase/permease subunit
VLDLSLSFVNKMMRTWIVVASVGFVVVASSGLVSAWTGPAVVLRQLQQRPLYPTTLRPFSSYRASSSLQSKIQSDNDSEKSNDPMDPSSMVHVDHDLLVDTKKLLTNPIATMAMTAWSVWLVTLPDAAYAAGPDWGIFEGRIGSLLHPLTMGSLLVYSLYTAYLGFQWRRQRTMGDEIAALKQKLPPATSATSVEQELGAVAAVVQETRQISTLEAQIAALTRERKEIASKGPRDQHFSQGALLACIGTLFAIEVRKT